MQIQLKQLEAIHGHNGRTRVEWADAALAEGGEMSELMWEAYTGPSRQRIAELEARIEALEQLLRDAIEEGHIYGNDSEQWLVKAEAALAAKKMP